MVEATKETFDELVAQGVVLVDFYAPWCGPCRMLSPVLEGVTNAKVVKVNVDQQGELADQFNVSAIPKIVILKDGVAVAEMVGLKSQVAIQRAIDEAQVTPGITESK